MTFITVCTFVTHPVPDCFPYQCIEFTLLFMCHVDRSIQGIQKLLSQEHAIQEVLFQSGFTGREYKPKRIQKNTPPDACRLHGTLVTNKVSRIPKKLQTRALFYKA